MRAPDVAELDLPALVSVPATTYLVAEGTGRPDSDGCRRAARAITAIAETLKLQMNLEGSDYPVGEVETLAWREPAPGGRTVPRWKLLLATPAGVDAQLVTLIKQSLLARRHLDEAADVRLEEVEGAACVQALHEDAEPAERALDRIHAYLIESRLAPAGPPQEIHLDGPHRRTLIRQPVG